MSQKAQTRMLDSVNNLYDTISSRCDKVAKFLKARFGKRHGQFCIEFSNFVPRFVYLIVDIA